MPLLLRTKRYIRVGREDGVEDAPPPIVILQKENILDNGRQAQFRKRAIQASLHERCPLPLQRPLAAHVPLQTQGKAPCHQHPERSAALNDFYRRFSTFTLQTRATRDTATLL